VSPRTIRIFVYALIGLAVAGASFAKRTDAERKLTSETRVVAEQNAAAQSAWENRDQPVEALVRHGTTWSELLQEMEFDPQTVYSVTEAARPVFNLKALRPGNKLTAVRSRTGELRSVTYRIDPERELLVNKDGEKFRAEIKTTPGTVRTVAVHGTVEGSLFDSVIAAGEKPDLAVRLAEIFAWDMDFNTDTQAGDVFRLVVEKKEYSDGSPATYGRILAAEYDNVGHPYQAVLFHDPHGAPAYYSSDGKSLQKAFLRSPLRFAARVSSHFSKHRYHPILKISRPHLGTDYAAPVGTPVQTIADGRVVFAGRKGGDGNLVRVAHTRGYETYYLHLSRVMVRHGQSVHQGQRIGLVGATGLATGPHLDFRIRQNGRFVNFERLRLPPANPVAKRDWAEFVAARDQWMALLPPADVTKTAQSGKAASANVHNASSKPM
jgi:murein DD-endopeptidase MepM/ murein hydrolase activator NlpD